MKKYASLIILAFLTINCFSQSFDKQNLPISTKWTLDASGESGRNTIPYVFLIVCPDSGSKGTGFQLRSGVIITCAHVIGKSKAFEIMAISPDNSRIWFKDMKIDVNRDLAILTPISNLTGGLSIGNEDSLKLGNIVSTWGFPYGHNGPSPLLSVGFLAGYKSYKDNVTKGETIKHLVVNGAFNPGNSGGPLFAQNLDKVIGIVVSKVIPLLSDFDNSAIKALSENTSGAVFTRKNSKGKTEQLVESQVVAMLLQSYQSLTQVMIGEAISVEELKDFLKECGIKE